MEQDAIKMAESKYKVFDSLTFLIIETCVRISELKEIKDKTPIDEFNLSIEIFKLKALIKLAIVESIIKKQNKGV